MTDRLSMNVPGKADYVGTVRMAAASVASRAGFDIEAIDDIKVAISEACTNIVCHSHETTDFNYEVILDLEAGAQLTIIVKDQGVGFGTDEYIPPEPGEAREGGLGIFIINALMDDVDIHSEIGAGTSIRMVKYLQRKTA